LEGSRNESKTFGCIKSLIDFKWMIISNTNGIEKESFFLFFIMD
jgi:hypothetical protein